MPFGMLHYGAVSIMLAGCFAPSLGSTTEVRHAKTFVLEQSLKDLCHTSFKDASIYVAGVTDAATAFAAASHDSSLTCLEAGLTVEVITRAVCDDLSSSQAFNPSLSAAEQGGSGSSKGIWLPYLAMMDKSLPTQEVTTFFVYLFVWPVMTGNLIYFLTNLIYPEKLPNSELLSAVILLLPELTIGLLPSTCLALAVSLLRRRMRDEVTIVAMTIILGAAAAGTLGLLGQANLSGFLLFCGSGGCAAALCSLLLNARRRLTKRAGAV